MGAVIAILVAILVVIVLVLAMRRYLSRARAITESNEVRADFQRQLLLDLQDVRATADDDIAEELDRLIEKVRCDAPASNPRTAELDERIESAVTALKADPSVEAVSEVSRLLDSRNRRAKR